MSYNDKERIKSLYKLYGTAKFKINPEKFDSVTGNQNSQIQSYMNIIFFNNLKVKNFGYYVTSFIIIFIFIFIYLREFLNEFIAHGRDNWDEYKCDPRFLPYSGYVVKDDNKTSFESTQDNFYDCIKPISEKKLFKTFNPYNDLVSGIESGTNSLSSNVNKFSESISNAQSQMNRIKEITIDILNSLTNEENNKNQAVSSSSNDTLGLMKKLYALIKSINQLFVGSSYSTQSALTYIYGSFEGILVALTVFIVVFTGLAFAILVMISILTGQAIAISLIIPPFTIPPGLAVAAKAYSLIFFFWLFAGIVVTFVTLFLAVVVVMLLYKSFLKTVFGIDVDDRKTKTPKTPF